MILCLLWLTIFANQQRSEYGGVDVAAGDDADDFAGEVGGEGAGDGAGAGAFGDDVVVLGQEAKGRRDSIKIGDERAVNYVTGAFEHLWEDCRGADAIDP